MQEEKIRCAIVTGSGGGNGRAIALELAKRGIAVVTSDINEDAASDTSAIINRDGGRSIAVKADITNMDDCEKSVQIALDTFGSLDILVNNAGVLVRGGILDTSIADWDFVNGVNARGTFLMTKAAAPRIIESVGNIVIVASLAGLRGTATHLAYSSTKHALIGMTRCLALELAPLGVRVNAICPGLVETDMIMDNKVSVAERSKAYPMGRIGTPVDVARVVWHLVSPESAWTTGTCYRLDGGAGLGVAA